MMSAHCFDQATDNIPFCHPPFPEGMVPRSLQYEFCNSTPTLSQLPFTPYPSLQLHPSRRPSTYTCRSPSQSNQAQAISSRFPIYISQAENHLTEFYLNLRRIKNVQTRNYSILFTLFVVLTSNFGHFVFPFRSIN